MNLNQKIKKIKMLLLDVDGVLTDGKIILGNNDTELKAFDIHDGFGIKMAQQGGIKVGVITGRKSEAVAKRAKELQLDEVVQGQMRKAQAFNQILVKHNLSEKEVAFIGDDLFDLPVLIRAGFSVAVANAREEVKAKVDYVTQLPGGKGAVREVTDLILKTQNKWQHVLEDMITYD